MSWILPAAMAAMSLGSSIFGGSQSAKAAREAQQKLDEEKAENDAWFRRKYNEDYGETAAGQNMLRLAQDYAKRNWQRAEGAAAVGGGETEATAKAKEQGNQVVGNTLANMAAHDTQTKENADASHRVTDARLAQQQMSLDEQKAANISNAASGASNVLASGAATVLQSKMPYKYADPFTSQELQPTTSNTLYTKPNFKDYIHNWDYTGNLITGNKQYYNG